MRAHGLIHIASFFALIVSPHQGIAQGLIRLNENGGSDYVGFQAPASITTDLIWTLPSADGANDHVLATNNSGTLSFISSTAGAGDIKADGTVAMTGALKISAGSAAAPSITFNSASDMGFYSSAADVLSFVVGGVEVQKFTTTSWEGANTGDAYLRVPGSAVGTPGFSWVGDLDTGMYRPASGIWAFTVGGAEKLRVDSTGNVGVVNTGTLQAVLDINGDLKLKKNSSAPAACVAGNDGLVSLTSQNTICVCKGGTTSWVNTSDGSTACVW